MTGTRKGRTMTCTICGEQGHQSVICPHRDEPGAVNLLDIVKAEYHGKSPGYAPYWAYDVLAKERKAGIDSWRKRGYKRPGPNGHEPLKLDTIPGAISVTPRDEEPEVVANHKRAILEALDGMVKGEARTLTRLMDGIKKTGFWSDPHNIAHEVWALQKQGLVRFTERKGQGGVSVLEHIAIRPSGTAKLAELRHTPVVGQVHKVETTGQRHPVGRDGTDYRTQPIVAPGGPIERITPPPPVPTVKDAPVNIAAEIVDAATTWAKEKFEMTPEEMAARDTEVPSDHGFPLISALSRKHAKLEAAARLLEDAGLEDVAITVMDRDTYTDFEKEVLRLWEQRRTLPSPTRS